VPEQPITDVRAQKIRRFHIGGADAQLVVVTALGEIGFILKDPEGWAEVVRGVARLSDATREG
jgi:hypothetical protein